MPPLPWGIPIDTRAEASVSLPGDLRVVLTRDAFGQLFGYAYATSLEVSCLGTVVREGATFTVTRFLLLRQEGSGGHTLVDPEAAAELAQQLLAEPEGRASAAIRAWAHTHPGMGLDWSTTDEATCRSLVSDYLVSLVVGDGFRVRCRIDTGPPVPLTVHDVPVLYETDTQEAALRLCQAEVDEKLSAAHCLIPSLWPPRPRTAAPAGRTDVPVLLDGWSLGDHYGAESETGDPDLAYEGWDPDDWRTEDVQESHPDCEEVPPCARKDRGT